MLRLSSELFRQHGVNLVRPIRDRFVAIERGPTVGESDTGLMFTPNEGRRMSREKL
jgi:hypothetical protein